jgi:hypothetical protein
MSASISLKQIREGPAYRQSFVPHCREHKNFVDAKPFGEQAIEARVRKDATRSAETARRIVPQQTLPGSQHRVFQHLLNRGGNVLAPAIACHVAQEVEHCTLAGKIRMDPAGLVDMEMRSDLLCVNRLPHGRKAGQLALMPAVAKAQGRVATA